jgi:phospholipid/cholesterol/gamma-HCH transport system ATP-binding protein
VIAMSDASYIELAGMDKAFGDNRVFAGLSLSIRRGESIAIVGGSGCGKSLLLRMLVGLTTPDRGSIRFAGQELTSLDETGFLSVRRRMSMMFQGGALFDSLSVGENVAYALRAQLTLDEDAVRRRVAEKLTLVGLPGIEALRPAELSGGMKKRVALARAIAAEPEVLLFDEPTAGLDPPNTRRIDDLIRSIQRDLGITVVVVTHDLPSAYRVADRIAMLADRRILAVLPTEAFQRSSEPAIRAFVGAMSASAGSG